MLKYGIMIKNKLKFVKLDINEPSFYLKNHKFIQIYLLNS